MTDCTYIYVYVYFKIYKFIITINLNVHTKINFGAFEGKSPQGFSSA